VKGIIFRRGKKIIVTPPRNIEIELDNLPIPDRDLVLLKERYPPSGFGIIEVGRGCIYSCSFCEEKPPLRLRSSESIIKEIMLVQKKYGTREFAFIISSMLHNPFWMNKICKLIKKCNLSLIFGGYVNANQINKRILKIMKKAGLLTVSFGLESGSERILKKINKLSNLKKEKIINFKEIVKQIREEKILWRTGIIFGFPSETLDDLVQDIRIIRELMPDFFRFQFLIPKLGSEISQSLNSFTDLDKFHTGYLWFRDDKNEKIYYELWKKMEKLSWISEKNFLMKKFLKPRVLFLKISEYIRYSQRFLFKRGKI
jgi:anaerobic magnesium-protoporphyrin IX monomethyl ester cyclase